MPQISEIYAFIAEDSGPDDEGVVAFNPGGRGWMPMVAADRARVDSLRPMAAAIAKTTGQKIHLVRFSTREVLEEIGQ